MSNRAIKVELETVGYSQKIRLETTEKEFIKEIELQWLNRIMEVNNGIGQIIKKNKKGIEDYHEYSKEIAHEKIWGKKYRILDKNFEQELRRLNFMRDIKESIGDFTISDEEKLGHGNVYWRLVRPGKATDIGPVHRDSWFWKINEEYGIEKKTYKKRIKIWIAIVTEANKNGLLVESGSHKRDDIRWTSEQRYGLKAKNIDPVQRFRIRAG